MKLHWDVVVVGGGGSGLAAAVSAAESGLSVVVLEKLAKLGGTTGIAVGSFTAAGTQYQDSSGIVDQLDWHQTDAGLFAPEAIEARNNKPLRDFFLSQAAETLDWVHRQGVSFHGPSPEPPNRVPRMHNATPNAKAYIAAFETRLRRLGGVILCQAQVDRLAITDGRVTGVEVRTAGATISLTAKRGVVLATGDYANSPELLAKHKGDEFAKIEGINADAVGDGHRLAQDVGAALVNMDVTYGPEIRFEPPAHAGMESWLPTRGVGAKVIGWLAPRMPPFVIRAFITRMLVTWQHPEDSLLDDGAILVNQSGLRFCNELNWPEREIAIAEQLDKRCYLLLDRKLIEAYSEWPKFISTAPKIAYAYVDDYLRLRPDITCVGERLGDLARQRGISPESIERTVSDYNRAIKANAADPFGRKARTPLDEGRWLLLGPARAYFTTTEGGAAITESCQVLDRVGQPIAGLYAVGQVGLGGQILFGHGLHIGWALTSGRLVGRELARRD